MDGWSVGENIKRKREEKEKEILNNTTTKNFLIAFVLVVVSFISKNGGISWQACGVKRHSPWCWQRHHLCILGHARLAYRHGGGRMMGWWDDDEYIYDRSLLHALSTPSGCSTGWGIDAQQSAAISFCCFWWSWRHHCFQRKVLASSMAR